MHKCQFRKVISDIELNDQKYETLSSDIWGCRVLKGQCILKIIRRRECFAAPENDLPVCWEV